MKTMTIEELLCWAFVHELPKGGGVEGLANMNSAWRMLEASSWGKIASFAELMTVIDAGPGDAENFFIEQGEPHDDALAVGEAVASLARQDVAFPENWQPLADWPDVDHTFVGLTRAAELRGRDAFMVRTPARRSSYIVNLVVGRAILGGEMDVAAEPRKVRMVDRRGKPAWFILKRLPAPNTDGQYHELEVDGFDSRKGRPQRGAYRKFEFSEDPLGDILGRLDYQLWLAALRHVESIVSKRLVEHRLAPLERSATPWLPNDAGGLGLCERVEKDMQKKPARAA